MKIAVAQIRSCMGDLSAAYERIVGLSGDAERAGADLLVLPAIAVAPADQLSGGDRDGFLADETSLVARLAAGVTCPTLLPVCLSAPDEPIDEVVYLKGGKVVPLRLMGRLRSLAAGAAADRGQAQGADDMHPALSQPIIEVGGAKLGVALSHEELDDYVSYDYPVDAVVFCSTYGFGLDDASSAMGGAIAEARFKVDADAMGAWLIGVSGVGFCGTEVFPGSSFVLAPWGELAAAAPAFEETLMVADIDPGDEGPLKDPLAEPVFDPAVTAWGALCEGLAGIVWALGASDVSIVVDGRLHSMLACAVAVDALGPTRVHPMVLLTGKRPVDEASRKLVRNLRLVADEQDFSALGADGDAELARDLAWARANAACRANGWVLLASADKTSLALGSAPARDLACVLPFGDVYRSDVLALSRLRNTISPVIPAAARRAYDVEPVADSARGTDEARLEMLDYLLSGWIEWERPVTELAAERGDAELARNVVAVARKAMSELKGRVLAPTMSSKTIDEARGPLGLKWRDRVREEGEGLDLEGMARRIAEGIAASAAGGQAPCEGDDAGDGEESAYDTFDLLSMLGATEGGDGAASNGDLGFLFGEEDGEERKDGDEGSGGFFWNGGLFSEN